MKIAQFGAFHLRNYGDHLLPLIAAHQLRSVPGLELQAVSSTGCKSAFDDAVSSIGIYELFDQTVVPDAVLVGGGDIVQTVPVHNRDYGPGARDKLTFTDLWIGPSLFSSDRTSVLWNAPEVTSSIPNDFHALAREALIRANYLSVRDDLSRQYLLDVWPDAQIAVVPDTIWAVDSLWTADQLSGAYNDLFAAFGIIPPERSVIFQLDRRHIGQAGVRGLAERLDALAHQLSAHPVIIATGSFRSEDVLAREVSRSMLSAPVVLDAPRKLVDIISCIAHASFYAGSSRHGLIAASVFGVPGLCVAGNEVEPSRVSEFHRAADVLVAEWNQVPELLPTLLSDDYKSNLRATRDRAKTELQTHWQRIRHELEKSLDSRSVDEKQNKPHWHQLADYQCRSLVALADTQVRAQRTLKQMEIDRQQKEVKKLQKDVRGLQAEVRRMRNSLSWSVTLPLRSIARRLPRAATLVQRGLAATKKAVMLRLSSAATAAAGDNQWQVDEKVYEKIASYREEANVNKRKIVIYTAIFGGYDKLLLPEHIDRDVDYVCFTDQPRNNYGVWQMRSAPYYHPDPTRIARWVKTHPHELFPDHDVAVWLDANIVLKGNLNKYIEMVLLEGAHLGFVPHPHRECFYEEAEACKRLGKDSESIIDQQVDHYRRHGLPPHQPLFETGFMVVRLGNPTTTAALYSWWQQLEQFSRRDQLGLAWVIHHLPGLRIVPLLPQGASVRDHDDFNYFRHTSSRVLKIPNKLLQLGQVVGPADDVAFSHVKDQHLSQLRDTPIDIIVCVYNALEDVRLCLESARSNLLPPHRIIIVNDRSNEETTGYLRAFAAGDKQIELIENEENLGYTRSASRGLAAGSAGFRILLNSDTIVSANWALKMLDVANSSERIGIVGPLSNAAGAQSIPNIKSSGTNTAINILPHGLTPAEIDLACEQWSFAHLFPRVPLVHGFCFGVKKEVIDSIGLFDDENFKRYYGEENDYCLRASAAGFELALATNTFVFHRKSRSIEEEKRIVHMAEAGQRLRELYGAEKITVACRQVEEHPLLERMRRRAAPYFDGGWAKQQVSKDRAVA
ncbi:glycosyltransferase domain-containing protein [Microvirga pakistanensis]|uniref:glycosyltransferase domain-containing protein n=1 Tax=Microvirga pakistanensis TaxID=1682650 RepID=UPI00106BC58E|nr:glycosyltransferase domain-containing protein [Microvirga pakistanensis]